MSVFMCDKDTLAVLDIFLAGFYISSTTMIRISVFLPISAPPWNKRPFPNKRLPPFSSIGNYCFDWLLLWMDRALTDQSCSTLWPFRRNHRVGRQGCCAQQSCYWRKWLWRWTCHRLRTISYIINITCILSTRADNLKSLLLFLLKLNKRTPPHSPKIK